SCRLAGTRARAVQPASAIEANMCVAVSQPTRLCSMSTVSQANPARAMKRAAVMLPRDSQVPIAGWPVLSTALTGLERMGNVNPHNAWVSAAGRAAFSSLPARRLCVEPGFRRRLCPDLRHDNAAPDTRSHGLPQILPADRVPDRSWPCPLES